MADRVAVAAGAQLFQHQILGARIVAAQSADVEQRLQARIAVAKDGTDTLAGSAESARSLRGRPGCRVAPAARRPAIAGEVG